MKTFKYSQPSEYPFSLDSVFAPEAIANRLDKTPSRVLDLCAGCGVMGLELAHAWPDIPHIDFVEIQPEYREHFEFNAKALRELKSFSGALNFHLMNYEQLIGHQDLHNYDLILSNPPYFLPMQGRLSPSSLKNRSRFFIDSTFEKLLDSLYFSLAPRGQAWILVRPLQDHGINLKRVIEVEWSDRFKITDQIDIRGTELLGIKKG